MARHRPQEIIDARRLLWLAIVLFAALPGCSFETSATKPSAVSSASAADSADSPERAGAAPAASSTTEITVPDPSPSEPVTAVMTVRPQRASLGETVEVSVHVRIARAHFIHAPEDAEGPFVPVTVNLTLPEGIEPHSDWQLPDPEKGHGNSLVFRNSIVLRRSLRIVSNSLPETFNVTGELQYQVCTDELCWPQGTLALSAPLQTRSSR